jgi:putative ABC transport system permease protein
LSWWAELRSRVGSLFRRESEDRELAEELQFHLEEEVAARIRAGSSPAEARRLARAAFGPVTRAEEATRDARGVRVLEDLGRDLRYGARSLRRAPVFSAVVVLALGLGIGAATAMYSLLDGILIRPLPYPEADRLYTVLESNGQGGARALSFPTFLDWRESAVDAVALAYARGDDLTILGEEGAQRLVGAFVTGDYLQVVGTRPLLGRALDASDGRDGGVHAAVISHQLWLDRFGGAGDVLGQTLNTPDVTFTVVGVMPPGFAVPQWADAWVPLEALPSGARYVLERRDLHVDSEVVGRLAPGVPEEQAAAHLAAVAASVATAHGEPPDGWTGASLQSVQEAALGDVRTRLLLLAAAAALLLLVAFVNVANLYLARSTARAREFGVRRALGAGRGRLARQLVAESALLAGAGAVLGILLATVAVRLARSRMPDLLPRLDEVTVDGRVLAVSLAVAGATALLLGLTPALRASRGDNQALRSGGAGGADRRAVRVRGVLVVTQVALALVLVVGSGLLLRSLWHVQDVELGFDPQGIAIVRVFPPSPRYDDEAAAADLYRRLREAAAGVPGVTAAALANHLPMAGGWMPTPVETGGEPPPDGQVALFRTVSPDYFRVVGSELLRGRFFDDTDLPAPGGVVVNRTLAEQSWPGEDPVGRSITVFHRAQGRPDFGEPIIAEVVGVVADERYFGPESDAPAAVFVPYTWSVWPNIFVAARTGIPTEAVIPALRRALLAVDPELPIAGPGRQTQLRPMQAYMAESFQARRVAASLLAAFGLAAFLLAALGIFGVMAYVVALRRPELGVRIALGARRRQVGWLVTRQALRLAGAGMMVGLAFSLLAARYLQAQLFGVPALDPVTYGAVIVLFAAVAVIAALAPATRAARTDPMVALRVER